MDLIFALLATAGFVAVVWFLCSLGWLRIHGGYRRGAFWGSLALTLCFFIVGGWNYFWGRDAGLVFGLLLAVGLLAFAFYNSKRA